MTASQQQMAKPCQQQSLLQGDKNPANKEHHHPSCECHHFYKPLVKELSASGRCVAAKTSKDSQTTGTGSALGWVFYTDSNKIALPTQYGRKSTCTVSNIPFIKHLLLRPAA